MDWYPDDVDSPLGDVDIFPDKSATYPDQPISTRTLSRFELFLLGSSEDMVDALFARWSPDLILKLRPVSSSMLFAVEAYSARTWDIHHFLGRWFYHVPSFLTLLESCGGIISGSEAQQFLGRREFRGRDLEIYVPWHGVLELGRWLKSRGFAYQPTVDKHPLFDAAVIMASAFLGPKAIGLTSLYPTRRPTSYTVFHFVRPAPETHHSAAMGTFIQIVALQGDPVEFVVLRSPSTGLINYLTPTHAVSLFPRTTFIHRQMITCQDIHRDPPAQDAWFRKWRSRGFEILTAAERFPTTPELRTWKRCVGDRNTWVLPYSLTHSASAKRSRPVLHKVDFEVLPHRYGVAPSGAMLRIGPRFMYSSIAVLANPWVDLGRYRSLELTAAFAEYFPDRDSNSDFTDDGLDDWPVDDMV